MAFSVNTRDQVNLEECVAADSLTNSNIPSTFPPAHCHGCFLKIQNRLKPFLSQWSRLFSFHLSERRRNQTGLKLLPRSRGAREWQKDRLWLQVSFPAANTSTAGISRLELGKPALFQSSHTILLSKMHYQAQWLVLRVLFVFVQINHTECLKIYLSFSTVILQKQRFSSCVS